MAGVPATPGAELLPLGSHLGGGGPAPHPAGQWSERCGRRGLLRPRLCCWACCVPLSSHRISSSLRLLLLCSRSCVTRGTRLWTREGDLQGKRSRPYLSCPQPGRTLRSACTPTRTAASRGLGAQRPPPGFSQEEKEAALSFSLTVPLQSGPAPAASHAGSEGRGDSPLPHPRSVTG